jgi:monoamine oxidase
MAAGDIGAARTRRFLRGYDALVDALAARLDRARIHLRCRATAVRWSRGQVAVVGSAPGGEPVREFRSPRAIVALPLVVLRAATHRAAGETPPVRFEPALESKEAALSAIGPGHALRLVLSFREPFWRDSPLGSGSFLHIPGAPFPAWWTGAAHESRLLTAWAGGPGADALQDIDERELVDRALRTIEQVFSMTRSELERGLVRSSTHPWSKDPLSGAAYSYPFVGGASAGEALAEPIDETLFFAGEAACAPPTNGTVEGAIGSGHRAAREVIRSIAAG